MRNFIEKVKSERWYLLVLLLFLVVGIAGCGESKTEPKDTPEDKLTDLAVGDGVTMYGVTVTVNSIGEGEPALGSTTYKVNVTYKNETGKGLNISPYDWHTVLQTGSDKAHVGGKSFNLETLKDGEEWTGDVTLWGNDDPVKVKFSSSFLSIANDDREATWLIQ
ncbi:hypothetical protein ACYSNR_18445 [Enterococcus sp. LJL128]|uniref:hypothetical protein n=1 Tax=Enterococcus sp. LJL51 TaxID=3416656 RepID=UPI003CE8D206